MYSEMNKLDFFITDGINLDQLAKYHENILKISSLNYVLIAFTNFHAAILM